MTLAIETSCDDTCVAVLEKKEDRAELLFNKKVTSDNRQWGGIVPRVAIASHMEKLPGLVREALAHLPPAVDDDPRTTLSVAEDRDGQQHSSTATTVLRRKPDFVSVTRGPGIMTALAVGLSAAKALSAGWNVPLVGVNHMQAHALTPRLVSALSTSTAASSLPAPSFPFFSLLVSGGHTLLLESTSPTTHRILAEAQTIAVGDMLDKAARAILPAGHLAGASGTAYAAQLEPFGFPTGWEASYSPPAARADEIRPWVSSTAGWTLAPPLHRVRDMAFDFTGLNGAVADVARSLPAGEDGEEGARRELARATLALAFQHLASRVVLALGDRRQRLAGEGRKEGDDEVRTLVVAGGVASSGFLRGVLRGVLDARGYGHVGLVVPPPPLCTDNAAMIAWAGAEMYEAGWRTRLDVGPRRKWSMDPRADDGGILGVEGWYREDQLR